MVNISNESMTWDDDDIQTSTYALKPLSAASPRLKDDDDQSAEDDFHSLTNPTMTLEKAKSGAIAEEKVSSSSDVQSIKAVIHACEDGTPPPVETSFSPSASSSSAYTIAGGARRRRTTAGRNIGRGGGIGGSCPKESKEGGDGGSGGGDDGVGGGRAKGEREKKSGDTRKGFVTNLGFISGMDTSNVDELLCEASVSGNVASFKKGIDEEDEVVMERGGGKESHEEDDVGAVVATVDGEFHGKNADDLAPNTGGLMGESLEAVGVAVAGEELEMVQVERVLTAATTAEQVSLSARALSDKLGGARRLADIQPDDHVDWC